MAVVEILEMQTDSFLKEDDSDSGNVEEDPFNALTTQACIVFAYSFSHIKV
jgi:hypothetical protein